MQTQGCAALHALARRSALLAHEAAAHGAASLVCKAMRTFRTNCTTASGGLEPGPRSHKGACRLCCSRGVAAPPPGAAARLQACACAALAALAEAPAARAQLQASGGAQLLLRTLSEHGSDGELDAAVQVCGWRALLALLAPAPPPAAEALDEGLHAPPELLTLLWHAVRMHARRAGVQAVCAEALTALLAEDARRAARRRADLQVLTGAPAAQHALRQLSGALATYGHDADVTLPSLAALEELLAAVADRRGLLVPADLRELGLQALLQQMAAAAAPEDDLLRKRIGRIYHRMGTAGLLEEPAKKGGRLGRK